MAFVNHADWFFPSWLGRLVASKKALSKARREFKGSKPFIEHKDMENRVRALVAEKKALAKEVRVLNLAHRRGEAAERKRMEELLQRPTRGEFQVCFALEARFHASPRIASKAATQTRTQTRKLFLTSATTHTRAHLRSD